MIFARQSTAIIVTVGPVLDADGVAVTDGVIADLKLSKNGGAPAALNGSATLTHRHTGYYSLSLTATDVNTVGTAEVTMDDTVNSMPMKEVQVVEEAVYDRDYAASATGIVGTAQSGDAYAVVNSGTFGNSALKTLIDAVDNFIDTEIADIQSRLPAALVGGRMDSSVGAMAANVVTAAAVADGAIDRATFAADTGLQTIRSGTAQAGAITSITLDAGASAVDDFYNECLIYITGGLGAGQSRWISDYNGTSKVASVATGWGTTPDNTSTFAILPDAWAIYQSTSGGNTLGGLIDAALGSGIQVSAISKTGYRLSASGVSDILRTALVEAYAADGVAPTLSEAVFLIMQMLTEMTISGTTMTIKKLDGTTTAATLTLNSALAPTSVTRAT